MAEFASIADSSAKRRTGLLKHSELVPGDGLWIVPCEGVHTFAMKFAIDIVFLNKKRVVRKIRNSVPKRRIALDLMAHSVLELPAGTMVATRTEVGDQLEFETYEVAPGNPQSGTDGAPGSPAAPADGMRRSGLQNPVRRWEPLLLLAMVLLPACTHRLVTVHDPLPPPAPATQVTMRRQVLNAMDAGEGELELRQLRERIAAAPSDVDARLALAKQYRDRGFPDLELEHYRLAVARFPHSAASTIALVKALHAAHSDREAQDAAVAYCRAHPDGPAELFGFVAILEDNAENLESAEPWHAAAILREPRVDAWHNNLGYNLLLQGRHAEAAAEFRQALHLNSHSEIARNNLGVALAANPKEAVLQWQSISDPATAHSNMAAILIEQKRYAEARKEIQAALGFSPRHPAALVNLSLVAELDGKGAPVVPARSTARQRAALVVRKVIGAN